MTKAELIQQGNELFEKIDRRDTHLSNYYALQDFDETILLVQELKDLGNKIETIQNPTTLEDVYINELKRLCVKGADILNGEVSPHISTPQEVIDRFSVTATDLDIIKDWLLQNRERIISANKFLYQKYAPTKKTDVELGDPISKDRAEKLLLEKMENLKTVLLGHPTLSSHFKDIFDTYHITVSSTDHRSFANRVSRITCLSTEKFLYMTKAGMGFEPHILISTFGHEVLGHCANFYKSDNSDLPFFIKWGFFSLTSASREAVSHYFEQKIFSYVKQSTKLDELFDGEFNFSDIEELQNAITLIHKYQTRLYSLAVWVLAHSSMNKAEEQIEEIAKYSIEKKWPSNIVNRRRNDWNRATGLLLPNVVSELRYAVDVLSDDIIASAENLEEFEMKILQGMWTPEGMREFLSLRSS